MEPHILVNVIRKVASEKAEESRFGQMGQDLMAFGQMTKQTDSEG